MGGIVTRPYREPQKLSLIKRIKIKLRLDPPPVKQTNEEIYKIYKDGIFTLNGIWK